MKTKKYIYLSVVFILMFSFYAHSVLAAEFYFAKKGGNVSISKDEQVKNLYTAGNLISINGDIEKGFYAAGNVVTVNGDVDGSISVVGGTTVIRGNVEDSVHVGGGSILIEGQIKEDLFLAGGNIIVSNSASVGGDLIVGGGTVDIQGPINGDVRIAGGQVIINSEIGGKINVIADELKLGSQANIVNGLNYKSPKEAFIDDGALVLGEINFIESKYKEAGWIKHPKTFLSILTLGFLIKILGMIVVGLVLIYVFKSLTKELVKEGLTHFWSNLGHGFAALILTPVACIILLFTVVGIWLAGLLGITYLFMVILALGLASVTFGSWLIKVLKKQSEYSIDWQAVVLGVIVLKIIIWIPIVGWLIGLIFVLVSLGSIYQLAYQSLRK